MCVRREKEKTDRKTGERLESSIFSFCKQRISSFREENKKTYLPMPSKGTYSPEKVFATLPLCLSKVGSYRSLRVPVTHLLRASWRMRPSQSISTSVYCQMLIDRYKLTIGTLRFEDAVLKHNVAAQEGLGRARRFRRGKFDLRSWT